MPRRSNKSIAEILSPTNMSLSSKNDNHNNLSLLERKITIAIEGFTSHKFCELILKDRKRSSKENALNMSSFVNEKMRIRCING
jgi:hypothetical protein